MGVNIYYVYVDLLVSEAELRLLATSPLLLVSQRSKRLYQYLWKLTATNRL